MIYAKGTHLDHKGVVGYMFVVQDYNSATNEYFGELYQKKQTPTFLVLKGELLDQFYTPSKHKYKVGDKFSRSVAPFQGEYCMVITKLMYAGCYLVTKSSKDKMLGERVDVVNGLINDEYIDAYQFKHDNPAPPPPVGCQHKLVDIGVRHTRMVCMHCDHEQK